MVPSSGSAEVFERTARRFALIAETTLTPSQILSIVGTELLAPDSNGFIRSDDSMFVQKILDIAEAHAEAMINPDSVADDFRREPMAVTAILVSLHRISFSVLRPKLTMLSASISLVLRLCLRA